MTGNADFLLLILRRFRVGLLLRFLRRVEQAELLIPVVQDIRPLLAALPELGALKIQDDLSESLNLLILLSALFPERINCHVLLSIVFQVYLFSGFQFFKYYG